MGRRAIDAIIWSQETFDSECIVEDLLSHSSRIVVIWGTDKGEHYAHVPEGYDLKDPPVRLPQWRWKFLSRLMAPPVILLAYGIVCLYFLRMGMRFKVKTVILKSPYACAMVGVLRRLGFMKRLLFFSGDWIADDTAGVGLVSRFGRRVVFPLCDYFACKFSDWTLNQSASIAESRDAFWGRKISKHEETYTHRLTVKRDSSGQGSAIAFLGWIREDSGLEIVLRAMASLKDKLPLTMRIAGRPNDESSRLRAVAEELGISDQVEFLGFADRSDFPKLFDGCFAGVNLITSEDSYTTRSIPAKVYDYMQYLVPPLVSRNLGATSEMIEAGGLGAVTETDVDSVAEALVRLHREQSDCAAKLREFIESREHTDILQFIDLS